MHKLLLEYLNRRVKAKCLQLDLLKSRQRRYYYKLMHTRYSFLLLAALYKRKV